MIANEARFQYFYCTRSLAALPYPDVPTRDVTNTRGAGYKTEPHLEVRAENWCRCRALFITAAAKRGRKLAAEGGQHYLLLTTRRPEDAHPFIVALMPFSENAFVRLLQRNPGRWSDEDYLPYTSDRRLKLVSFRDAFSLKGWMKNEGLTTPGGQGGRGIVPDNLLRRAIAHFSTKQDQTKAFLDNVCALETQLKKTDAAHWADYKGRLRDRGGCSRSVRNKC